MESKKMTTQDTNKMIAYYADQVGKESAGNLILLARNTKFIGWYNLSELKFHSSIEWLYPVARKVKEELEKAIMSFNNTEESFDYVYNANQLKQKLELAAKDFKIESLYPVVVECIEFLNKQKDDTRSI